MKKTGRSLAAIIVFALTSLSLAQAQNFGQVVRVDPAAYAIGPADTLVEKAGDNFGFPEGPVWVLAKGQGYLLFSDIPANVICKWDPKTGFSVFLKKSGFTGIDAAAGVAIPIPSSK
jgi:gluconolactonase